jgi:hypothetical protein
MTFALRVQWLLSELHLHTPDQKAGFSLKTDQTGAVILIQRFGSALNLNIHSHLIPEKLPLHRYDRALSVQYGGDIHEIERSPVAHLPVQ